MIVLDSSFLYALLDRRDRRHAEASRWYRNISDSLATSPLILAEVDYLAARAGRAVRDAFRHDVGAGAYTIGWWGAAVGSMVDIANRYSDLGVSLADASLVALAARLGTTSIATFDELHFRAMQPLTGASAFRLLPADA